MKRELIQNTLLMPIASGSAINRNGFLSGVIGAVVGTAGDLTLTVTHSDNGTDFVAVTDEYLFGVKYANELADTTGTVSDNSGSLLFTQDCGVLTLKSLSQNDVVNVDLDLVGLKKFIKITASGTAATSTTLAIALGDGSVQPV